MSPIPFPLEKLFKFGKIVKIGLKINGGKHVIPWRRLII